MAHALKAHQDFISRITARLTGLVANEMQGLRWPTKEDCDIVRPSERCNLTPLALAAWSAADTAKGDVFGLSSRNECPVLQKRDWNVSGPSIGATTLYVQL